MVSYYYHRKDKGTLKICEDSLTATLFDNLKHLPSALLWEIISKSLIEGRLPHEPGELLSISYWDKWNPTDTQNANFVEPDVFLRFENLDLIVEAKRYNDFQQKDDQIINEITAYFNEYKEDNKKMYFLQLGGLQHGNSYLEKLKEEHVGKFVMCKTNWLLCLDQIVKKHNKLKTEIDTNSKSYCRILEDIIHGFELHQFYKKIWLADISKMKIEIDNFAYFQDFKRTVPNPN